VFDALHWDGVAAATAVLGVSEADRRTIFGTKPILRSITGKGYYIWRAGFLPA
jgi:hypothetical protein